jgi:hypothetical protein
VIPQHARTIGATMTTATINDPIQRLAKGAAQLRRPLLFHPIHIFRTFSLDIHLS